MRWASLAILWLVWTGTLFSQSLDKASNGTSPDLRRKDVIVINLNLTNSLSTDQAVMTSTGDDLVAAGGKTENEFEDARRKADNELEDARLQDDIFTYTFRRRVFEWTFLSSVILFWMVNLVVLTGLVFSGMQFNVFGKNKRGAVTELELDLKGIKVKSPIVGLVILAMSIAFFFLYLHYVYPITTVENTSDANAPASSAGKP